MLERLLLAQRGLVRLRASIPAGSASLSARMAGRTWASWALEERRHDPRESSPEPEVSPESRAALVRVKIRTTESWFQRSAETGAGASANTPAVTQRPRCWSRLAVEGPGVSSAMMDPAPSLPVASSRTQEILAAICHACVPDRQAPTPCLGEPAITSQRSDLAQRSAGSTRSHGDYRAPPCSPHNEGPPPSRPQASQSSGRCALMQIAARDHRHDSKLHAARG